MVLYSIVYLFGNLFNSLILYKYMQIFFSKCKYNKRIEYGGYLINFILTSYVYICFQTPIVSMTVSISCLLLISMSYVGSIKKRILSVIITYVSEMCIETIVVLSTTLVDPKAFAKFEYSSIAGTIIIKVLSYAMVVIVNRFKNIQKSSFLPNSYWISLAIVPIGTIGLFFGATAEKMSNNGIALIVGVIFAINIVVFQLYDYISNLIIEKLNSKAYMEQTKFYENQIEMMETSMKTLRIFKHDLKNKLLPIFELISLDNKEKALEQLYSIAEVFMIDKQYIHSGNSSIDSIINFKLQEAEKECVQIVTDVCIPANLCIDTLDIAIMLGNSLDNAFDGVKTLKENRWIDVRISQKKGCLIIAITNSYDGIMNVEKGQIKSRKEDSNEHGFGLESIKRVVEKYNGVVDTKYDEEKFSIKIMIYI